MKKTFVKPVIEIFYYNNMTILAGSGDAPMVTSTQSEENSEGLSKGSNFFSYGYDEDNE